jgi:hypothetical protein
MPAAARRLLCQHRAPAAARRDIAPLPLTGRPQAMDPNPARVFISYRRDDAAGYAGRLEEDLERRLGRGKVFRDVQDIPPGEDFVATIRKRLADAHTVLVLIGPRWAGGEVPGQRRIDDERDFVRLEVQVALESGARVVPLVLPGATMPAEDVLPEPLKALARRNALPISDPNWDADITRLVASFGLPPRRPVWPWAVGGAAVVAAVVAAVSTLHPPSDLLAFRLLTTGGFSSHKPIEFEARRSAPADAVSAPTRP